VNSEHKQHLLRSVAEVLEVPRDIVLDLPRITITGNVQMIVENHRGIVEFNPSFIRLRTGTGELRIRGENLKIAWALREEIVIDGRILGLELAPGMP